MDPWITITFHHGRRLQDPYRVRCHHQGCSQKAGPSRPLEREGVVAKPPRTRYGHGIAGTNLLLTKANRSGYWPSSIRKSIDEKIRIFISLCHRAAVDPAILDQAFPSMLRGEASDFYYHYLQDIFSFSNSSQSLNKQRLISIRRLSPKS